MISILLIVVFIAGYVAIAFEHTLHFSKAASALITGVLCWMIYMLQSDAPQQVEAALLYHIGAIASILFFLLGAMTIVELVDSHNGFEIITEKINTRSISKLLLIVSFITFFLSAILDNLTTAIIMASLSSKLIERKTDKLWFCGMIVIAANAGGVWSPLGDVTTSMLWIDHQITALTIVKKLILPSMAVCVFPAAMISWHFKNRLLTVIKPIVSTRKERKESLIVLISGFGFLILIPAFKTLTHLPPFMGMLLALGLMWVITTIIHKGKEPAKAEKYSVSRALEKVDTPSILFFLGILLAVAALQSYGLLKILAVVLNSSLKNDYLIGTVLGLVSAFVDNVPLVAATQGMYDLSVYPTDHPFWEFLALTTGTGGSIIIIGSAAGVAVMGIEQIDFLWYFKRISWLALMGFAAGIIVYLIQLNFT